MLHEIPFSKHFLEKTASGGPDEVVHSLVSGDVEKFASLLDDEDRAFFALSENTIMKIAAGMEFSDEDIDWMSDQDVSAITVLGENVYDKVAAQLEFLNLSAEAELAGRGMAHAIFQKMAGDAIEAHEEELVARQQKIAESDGIADLISTEEGKAKLAAAVKAAKEKKAEEE